MNKVQCYKKFFDFIILIMISFASIMLAQETKQDCIDNITVKSGDALQLCVEEFESDVKAFQTNWKNYIEFGTGGLTERNKTRAYLYPASINPDYFNKFRREALELKKRSDALYKRLTEMQYRSAREQGTLKIGKARIFIWEFWTFLLHSGLIKFNE